MLNRCFIITGTSRGIGEALAKLLLEDDHYVFGISRGRSESLSGYKKYFHKNYDLSNLEEIEDMLREILTQFPFKEAEMICLINNAAMLEPLKPIQHCKTSEITKNLQISLIAPMILSSCFIRITNELKNRKKIINISSGSGAYPSPSMSIYSTAKAGINMFTRCIGLEQKNNQYPVEIIGVDPGMVETEMQKFARSIDDGEFEMATFFKEAFINGQLQSTDVAAKHLRRIIDGRYKNGEIVNFGI